MFSVRVPQNQWRCVWKYKSREKKNGREVHVHAHDRCQANLFMGWLVCACNHNFSWSDNHFFLALHCRPNTFWSMYPGTVWCTQMLRIAIHCYQYKDCNHGCKDGYILGKTPVSPVADPGGGGDAPPPPPPLCRPKKKKEEEKEKKNRPWDSSSQTTAAAARCLRGDWMHCCACQCPQGHTLGFWRSGDDIRA